MKTYYYNIKYIIINYFKYARIIARYRPWDYQYILEMMKFQLEQLCNTIEKYGNEVDDYRLYSVGKMKRAIELLNNNIKNNYIKRSNSIGEAKILESKEWNELFDLLKNELQKWWD